VPGPFKVILSLVPLDIPTALTVLSDLDDSLSGPNGLILPAAGIVESPLCAYLRERTLEQRVLRSFTR
jgi:hypothetical protein